MRAMILAAGFGTRLLPLTNSRPKALFPLRGITMLEFWIRRLGLCGFDAAFLNAFHMKDRIVRAVSSGSWPVPVTVVEEPVLLGTGGGIRGALDCFGGEPAAVINVDILTDADLPSLFNKHRLSGAEVSLLLHDCPRFNNVAVDEGGSVLGFGREAEELRKGRKDIRLLAFTGIHFINPGVLAGCAPGVPGEILNVYRDLITRGSPPRALFQPGLFWREMGSLESYRLLTRELALLPPGRLEPVRTGENFTIDPEAVIHPSACLQGTVVAGRGTRVGEGANLEDVILWDDTRIEKGSSLKNCIVADGIGISGCHTGKIFAPAGNGGENG